MSDVSCFSLLRIEKTQLTDETKAEMSSTLSGVSQTRPVPVSPSTAEHLRLIPFIYITNQVCDSSSGADIFIQANGRG